MGWLFERYRQKFAALGYNYPPSYMLIADAGVALFCLFAAGQRIVSGLSGWQWLAVVGAVVVGVGPGFLVLWDGRRPYIAALPVSFISAVVLFWSVPVHGDVAPLILVAGATMAAAVVPPRQAVGCVAVFAVAAAMGAIAGPSDQGWLMVLMVCFGGFIGQLLQQQLRLVEIEHREHARQQVLERARIAGEVHDVVAHSLSIVLLNVTAARRALEFGRGADGVVDPADIDEALEALRDAETQGRGAMDDVRHAIDLLRSDVTADAAQPGLDDLDDLVEGFRRAGTEVVWRFRPPAEPLSRATELAVYRVVQESLTNASKHAPGAPITVDAGPQDDGFGVRVTNLVVAPTRQGTTGLGLAGMASRVENLGGSLRARADDDRWLVDARFCAAPTTSSGCVIDEALSGR